MKKINIKLSIAYLTVLCGLMLFSSCNKGVEDLAPVPQTVYPSGKGIAATIAANPNDSLFSRLIIRAGLTAMLNDSTKTFTIFAVDNAGMNIFANAASLGAIPIPAPHGVISAFISNNISPATAAAIVLYNTVGQKYPFSAIGTGFPNHPMASQIVLDPTQPFVRMPIFPSRRTTYSYVNNIPVTGTDQLAANGIIHHTFTIVSPLPAQPLITLKTLINNDADLTYFKAAIARGDSGQVGISGVGAYGLRFDSVLNIPVTNLTVLAPNNAACQTLVFGSVYGALLAQGVPAATALAQATAISSSPAGFNALPVAVVRGVVAYHILASKDTTLPVALQSYKPNIRAFSVNFSPNPGVFVKTLVNGSVEIHPGIMAQATFTGPIVSALKFTGLGTFPPGGAPFSGPAANATAWDKIAINGVMHVIDRVLLPQ
jgi:hypothetical protein